MANDVFWTIVVWTTMYCTSTTIVSTNDICSTASGLLMSKPLTSGLLTSGLLTFGLLVYWCLMTIYLQTTVYDMKWLDERTYWLVRFFASSKGLKLTRILCNRRLPNSCCSFLLSSCPSSCHPVFVFWLAFSIIILFEWGDWNVNNEIILLNLFTYHSSTGTDCHRLMIDIQVGFNKIIISTSIVSSMFI